MRFEDLLSQINNNNNNNNSVGGTGNGGVDLNPNDDDRLSSQPLPPLPAIITKTSQLKPPPTDSNNSKSDAILFTTTPDLKKMNPNSNNQKPTAPATSTDNSNSSNNNPNSIDDLNRILFSNYMNNNGNSASVSSNIAAAGGGGSSAAGPNLFSSEMDQLNALLNVGGSNSNLFANNNNNVGASSSFSFADGDDSTSTSNNKNNNNNNILAEKLMLENYYAAMMQQQQTLQQNPSLMFGNLQNSGHTAGLIANGGLVTSQDTLLGSSNSQASSIEKQTTISNSPDGANQQFAPFNRPFVTNSPGPGGSATSTGGPNQPMDISGVIGRPPPSFHPHQMPFGPYLPYSPYRIAAPGPPMMAYHPGFSPGNSPFAGSTMQKNPSVHDGGGGGGPPNPHPNLPLFHPSQALPPNYYPAPMMMSNFFHGSPGGVPTGGQPQSATEQQLILNQQLQNYYNYAAMAAAAANASAAAVAGNSNEMPTTTVPSTSTVSSSNGRQFVNRQVSSSSSAGSSSGTKSKSAQSQKNSQSLIGTTSSTTAAASATTGAPTTNRIRMNVEELFTLTKAFTESKIQESPNSNATPIANNNNSQANQSSSTVFVESTATITGSSSLKSKAANKKSKKSKPVSSLTSTTTTAVSSSSSSVRYDENNPMKAYDWNLAMKQQQQSDDDNGDKEANPDGTDNELKRFIDIVNKVSSNASVVNNRQDGDLNKNNKKSFESTNASSSADPMKKKRNRRNKNNNQEEAKVNQPLLHQKASAAPSASKIAYNELVKKNLEHKTTSSSSSSVPTLVPKETNNNNKKKNKQQNISTVSNTTTTAAAASRPIQPQPQQLQTKPNKKPANNLNQASTSSGPVPGPARQNQQSDRQDRKRTKQTANNNIQNSVLMPASSLVVNKGAIPKPKERTYLNENFSMEVIKNFKQILMTSPNGAAAAEIINGQFNPKALSYLYTMILEYFRHLEFRFKLPTTDYVNLIDPHQYFYEDFNSFGSQFWDYVNESKFYPQELITKYVSLVKTYEQLHPPEILQLRTTLFKLKQSLSLVPKSQINDNAKNCPIRLEMITYQKVDPKNLYSQICELTSVEREISYFISVIQLSQLSLKNLDEFVSILNSALMSTELAQFGPEICTFGSLSNGLGTYNSDIDIFVKFDKLGSKILDYSTAVLALEVIEQIFQQNLGYKSKETIIYSRRCPIIKLNFRVCFAFLRNLVPAAEKDKQSQSQQSLKTLEFNKCDISLNQIYGVYNSKLLNFFAKIEPRFYELTMILKYWAKRRDLIGNNSLSTYAFTMLIIYFLQAQNPPILPTIVKLQKLAQKQKNKKRIKVHKWYFEFCDDLEMIGGPSTNTKKTPELLVNFFKFYRTYDFYNNAIRPKFGKSCKKFALRQEKQSEGIESMFNMCSYFCIEDPFVLDHNVGYNFRTKNIYRFTQLLNLIGEKITEENCIRLLLDDSPKNDVQPPLSPIFYIPSNLFYYEIVFPDLSRGQNSRNISRQFVYRPIHVTPGNLRLTVSSTGGTKTKADFHQLSRSLLSLFSLVITQLFNGYFQFPPGTFKLTLNDSRLQLNCMAEHGYVDYLIHFRKMYGLNELLQRCRPSSTNEINSKILKLKDIGYRLFRFNNQNKFCPHQRPKLEPLFSLDFSPLTDQMSNSNNSNNNNNYTDVSLGSSPLWCSMNLHTQANIFLNIVNEVLLQFSYAIDRSKPEEYFSNLVRQFFDVESTFQNSNNNQGMFNINSNNQQNPTNNLRQSYQFNANRQNH